MDTILAGRIEAGNAGRKPAEGGNFGDSILRTWLSYAERAAKKKYVMLREISKGPGGFRRAFALLQCR